MSDSSLTSPDAINHIVVAHDHHLYALTGRDMNARELLRNLLREFVMDFFKCHLVYCSFCVINGRPRESVKVIIAAVLLFEFNGVHDKLILLAHTDGNWCRGGERHRVGGEWSCRGILLPAILSNGSRSGARRLLLLTCVESGGRSLLGPIFFLILYSSRW